MPIVFVNAPLLKCRTCKHSLAVCTCHDVKPEIKIDNTFLIPDWTSITRLDIQSQRDKINMRRQHDADTTKRLLAERNHEMAVRLVNEADRKPRKLLSGKFSQIPDVLDMWKQLSTFPKEGKVMEVSIDAAVINGMKKDGTENPIKAIVNAVRRKLVAESFPFDVYDNGDGFSYTVIRVKQEAKGKK